ncbi:hypothetical protein [Kribbella rubisoli]|uniref:hypothetical protein n=1 Tax=Kribbella rubisoli TaxID=3075929 RepID=UPI001A7E5550|nr:hypothetical protein [Kribbella rubisoli]
MVRRPVEARRVTVVLEARGQVASGRVEAWLVRVQVRAEVAPAWLARVPRVRVEVAQGWRTLMARVRVALVGMLLAA